MTQALFEYPFKIIDMTICLCNWWAMNLKIFEKKKVFEEYCPIGLVQF
jgi:hypothetical protein